MAALKINKENVDRAPVPASNDALYWDTDLKGFGLRVTPKGVRSFVFQYRFNGAPAQRLTIGRYGALTPEAARKVAKQHALSIANGINPVDARRKEARQSRTLEFEGYATRFVEECLKEEWKDSWREVERLLQNHIIPRLKGRTLTRLDHTDIRDVIDPIRSKRALARKAWAVLSRLFTWAIEQQDLPKGHNPMDGMKPPPKPDDRKRTLSPDELVAAWRASFKLSDPFGPFIRVLIASLQRRNEVSGLPWKELSHNEASWTIDGERAKNQEDHLVPLNSLMLGEFEGLGWKHRGLVFTTTGKTPISGFSKMKRKLDTHMLAELQAIENKRAEAAGEEPHPVELKRWTIHDLRRTGATGLQSLGTPVEVVEALLNHKEGEAAKGIRKIYNLHKYEDEKRSALSKWAAHLGKLFQDADASNVITLAARRA